MDTTTINREGPQGSSADVSIPNPPVAAGWRGFVRPGLTPQHVRPQNGDWMVTPAVALGWLECNLANNRKIKRSALLRMVRDIKAGNWHYTGYSIKFDTLGRLCDGQHRLLAIILSGVALRLTVVTSISPDAMTAIDRGVTRTPNDVFTVLGEQNAAALATALLYQWRFENGSLASTSGTQKASIDEMQDTLLKHPGLRETTSRASRASQVISVGALAFLLYHFERRDPILASAFLEALVHGANIDGPLLLLRNRLLNRSLRARTQEKIVDCILTWNALRKKRIKVSFHKPGAPLEIPEIV